MNRQYIQNAFVNELLQTPEKNTLDKINDYILNTINTPQIQEIFKYEFETQQTPEQIQNIKLLMIIYFGFYSNEITNDYCTIDMKKFLN